MQKTQARFLGGTVARVDVVKAETDLAQAENDLFANDRAIATARASLNRILGRAGGAPIETTDTLEVPGPIAAIESLEKLAESSRPEIASSSRSSRARRRRRRWRTSSGCPTSTSA